jgi:hypothetical protein
MKKKTTKTKAAKLYFAVIQQADGTIFKVISSYNYDLLLVEAMDLSKETAGFWTVLNTLGHPIDGNFKPKEIAHEPIRTQS